MNFSKWLIFPNKEAMRQALIVYSIDNNKSYITEWSNQQKLYVKCVNKSCAWKVRAFSQQKVNRLWAITVYIGHHICPSVGVNKDGRMMDSNFLTKELHKYVLEDHTCKRAYWWTCISLASGGSGCAIKSTSAFIWILWASSTILFSSKQFSTHSFLSSFSGPNHCLTLDGHPHYNFHILQCDHHLTMWKVERMGL